MPDAGQAQAPDMFELIANVASMSAKLDIVLQAKEQKDRTIHRLANAVEEVRGEVSHVQSDVAKLDRRLFGNGQPGVIANLNELIQINKNTLDSNLSSLKADISTKASSQALRNVEAKLDKKTSLLDQAKGSWKTIGLLTALFTAALHTLPYLVSLGKIVLKGN